MTVWVYLCECGGMPFVTVYQACEDLMEAVAKCNRCGLETCPVKNVWGGEEIRLMAFEEWNDMRKGDELAKKT